MKRCRDCISWRVRRGCENPRKLERLSTVAYVPDKNTIYRNTECWYFEEVKHKGKVMKCEICGCKTRSRICKTCKIQVEVVKASAGAWSHICGLDNY